ncbi:MAG: beta-galactosidase [Halobacteriaceae archaeon]
MDIGVCYFPEHWPRERWERDVEQMSAAGIEVVRMGEFAWGELEPAPGEYHFDWLEEAVELVGEAGMDVVLCTPTATPPKWLVDEHPDVLQEEADGTARGFGGRRHYCFNSRTYREETERIVGALAERFAGNEHVVGWQTDNEYGCHDTAVCYCDDCARAFREWLRDRYGDAETLNESWGTAFWSQQHRTIASVDPPRHAAADHHPSRLLDYRRFSSDSVVDYNRLQTDLLRAADGDWFVTHNGMGFADGVDARDLGDDLDFLSWDSYPTGFSQLRGEPTASDYRAGDPDVVGFNHDLYRGAGDGPFWVMEQQPGDINWPPHSPQPAEGAMRLWAHQAVAHGADVVSYFRWRRCLEGQEQYHAGLRKQDGTADRGYEEAAQAAGELDEFDLAAPDADVALLHDYADAWALDVQPHSPDFDYWDHALVYYTALRARGVTVDVVAPDAVGPEYDAVVAPTLHVVDSGLAERLEEYVRAGGHLLLTIRSGAKDRHDRLRPAPAPGPLADLVGATVDQHESLPAELATEVTYGGDSYGYRTWGEWLSPDGAEVVAEHATGVGGGRPAAVQRSTGAGTAAYAGVWPGDDLADALVTDLLDRAGTDYGVRYPPGVRAAERDGHTWVTNFSGAPVRLAVPGDATFYVGGDTVEPRGVAMVDVGVGAVSVED